MKYKLSLFLVIALFFISSINCQTLKINENKYLSVVFDSNVIQAAVGNNNQYEIEFNAEGEESIILIKSLSSNTKESNLIVKTKSGFLYNINLIYGTEEKNIVSLSKKDGIYTGSTDSISINNSVIPDSNLNNESSTLNSIRENDYLIGDTVLNDSMNNKLDCEYCQKLAKAPKTVKRITDDSYNVKVQINNLYYYDNKLYFVINIRNSSDIDYNLNYIKSYIDSRDANKNSSTQYLEKNPIGIYNANRSIKASSNRSYIFVYDQFTIDGNKNLVFEINENNGERNLALKIPSFIINNPINIKKLK